MLNNKGDPQNNTKQPELLNLEFLERAGLGALYVSTSGIIKAANHLAETFLGASPEGLQDIAINAPHWVFVNAAGTPLPPQQHPVILALQNIQVEKNQILGIAAEKVRWFKINIIPDGEATQYIYVSLLEIDPEHSKLEGIKKDLAFQRQTRALLLLSNCNQVLIRATHENELLQEMCRICVEHGGYRLAWVGYAEENPEKTVHPIAEYGFEEGYLASANISWADTERGRGPTGSAIRNGYPAIAQNILTAPQFAPWREAAKKRGYAASIGLPIIIDGKTIGALSLYSEEAEAFQTEEVRLLSQLVNDLAYGIKSIRSRQQLHESEKVNRVILNATLESVFLIRLDGTILHANSECARRYGSPSPEAMIGRNIYTDYIGPQVAPECKANVDAVLKAQKALTFNVDYSGTTYWVNIHPIFDDQGEITSVAIYSRDITELKTTQNKLEELNRNLEDRIEERTADLNRRESMYRALFENSNDGIFLMTPEGKDLPPNQQALNLLGYTLEEYMALNAEQDNSIISPEEQQDAQNRFDAALRGEKVPLYERTFIAKDGRKIYTEINLSAIRDAEGKISIVQSVVRDITSRKKAEEALLSNRDELSLLNTALAKASKLKDEFLASMSHELRSPLTGILGLSEALQLETYGALNEKQVKSIKMIESSGKHLLDLINDILDLSKIEAGKLDIHFETVSVTDLCQASLQLVKGMAHQKHQNVAFSMHPASLVIQADARRVKQILVNLLSNAIKFTPEGGQIGLEVEGLMLENMVRFTVWDKGIGISPEAQEKLFKPFTQLDSSLSRQYSGTGLGLSLVQRMTKLHRGSIHVESTPGRGSRFTVLLPLGEPTAQVSEVEFKNGLQAMVNSMIIEDSEVDAQKAKRYLIDMGIKVIIHPILRGAFEKAVRLLPSVILLDLNLTDGFGLHLLAQLKQDQRTKHIPVIITSVEDHQPEAFKLGALGYLVKPYLKSDLLSELQKASAFAAQANPIMLISSPDFMPLILIADDNELNLGMLSDFLTSKGMRVVTTNSGLNLLQQAPTLMPDLMLIDIQMPGMDGLEVMRHIRKHSNKKLAATPIIAITALTMPGDRELCLQAGATEYISKPVGLQDLARRISEIVRLYNN